MLPVTSSGGWAGAGAAGAAGGGGHQHQQHRKQPREQHGGGGGHTNVVKDLKKNAGKATKGLLGFVSGAVQRTAEYLTHQEMTVGSHKVQIVREMAEGGVCISCFFFC